MRFLRRLIFLYLAYHQPCKNKTGARRKHSRYRKDFFRSLSIKERCWRYRKIPWCALIPLKLLPWRKLLASQNDQAYIAMMGFDCESFSRILEKFCPIFSTHTPFDKSGMIIEFEHFRGQKRVVQPEDCLGLVLVWTTCTRGSMNVLQLVFGVWAYSRAKESSSARGLSRACISMDHLHQRFNECVATCIGLTYSNLSVYLRFVIHLIVKIFSDDPLARVAIPSAVD